MEHKDMTEGSATLTWYWCWVRLTRTVAIEALVRFAWYSQIRTSNTKTVMLLAKDQRRMLLTRGILPIPAADSARSAHARTKGMMWVMREKKNRKIDWGLRSWVCAVCERRSREARVSHPAEHAHAPDQYEPRQFQSHCGHATRSEKEEMVCLSVRVR